MIDSLAHSINTLIKVLASKRLCMLTQIIQTDLSGLQSFDNPLNLLTLRPIDWIIFIIKECLQENGYFMV